MNVTKSVNRWKRRGTWGPLGGLAAMPLIHSLIPLETLLAQHGWMGLLLLVTPVVAGVSMFAIEKRGDLNGDGHVNATDVKDALDLMIKELRPTSAVPPQSLSAWISEMRSVADDLRNSTRAVSRTISSSNHPTVIQPAKPAAPTSAPAPKPPTVSMLPVWTPGQHEYALNPPQTAVENPKAGRMRRSDESWYPAAVMHSTESDAHAGYKAYWDGWGAHQTERFSGYHIVCALDLDNPQLMAKPQDVKMFHAGPWNMCAGVSLVMRVDQWADLTAEEQHKLASQAAQALKWLDCIAPGLHPDNSQPVSDSNPLYAYPHDVQLPQRGSHVAHDWLWSDRNKDGKITKADDWKSDPGEPAMNLIRSYLT